MLDAKANPEATDEHGWTAVHYATVHGNVEAVKFLLEAKCNLESLNVFWQNTASSRCRKWKLEIVKILIAAKANVESVDEFGGTPFHYAANSDVQRQLGYC